MFLGNRYLLDEKLHPRIIIAPTFPSTYEHHLKMNKKSKFSEWVKSKIEEEM